MHIDSNHGNRAVHNLESLVLTPCRCQNLDIGAIICANFLLFYNDSEEEISWPR